MTAWRCALVPDRSPAGASRAPDTAGAPRAPDTAGAPRASDTAGAPRAPDTAGAREAAPADIDTLDALAHACSPRVERHGDRGVVFDASGLARVLGPPASIAAELARLAKVDGLAVRIAIAPTMTACWMLAHAIAGPTVVEPGQEAAGVAPLPLQWLAVVPDIRLDDAPARRRRARAHHFRMAPGPGERAGQNWPTLAGALAIFDRWGLTTLADLARLPRKELHTRMGAMGIRLHQAACGEDATPLVPERDAVRFLERLELEWPIEGLEPLTFVLGRLCDALSASLGRADRGAVAITTRLRLVTRTSHERVLNLPAPIQDGRILRTLIALDLESHPPPAAIDVVEVEVDVALADIVRGSLFARAQPSAGELMTLLARLRALAGETRVGAAGLVDSYNERRVVVEEFAPFVKGKGQRAEGKGEVKGEEGKGKIPELKLRRLRIPLAVRVTVERGAPVAVLMAGRAGPGGRIVERAGPWRSSGHWWTLDRSKWDREAWDVQLADGRLCRLTRDRLANVWELDAWID